MKKKILVLSLAAVLLVVATVGGTLAYLTQQDTVTNTFTVGNITMTLDEAKTNELGKPVNADDEEVELADAPRVKDNDYHLIPGSTYVKDPTVTVKAGNEACYLFVKLEYGTNLVTLMNADKLMLDFTNSDIFNADRSLKEGWAELENQAGVVYKTLDKLTADEKIVVFNGFVIDGDKTIGDDLMKVNPETDKITVTAYAIQQANIDTAAEAWDALNPAPAPAVSPVS